MLKKKVRRTLLITSLIIVGFVILVIVFISPITKYLVEKYDVQYTGREIEMDWAYVNPFTGYVHFDDLKIYEHKSDSVFFGTHGISASFSLLKMIKGTYEINKLNINKPRLIVVQNQDSFNFTDLIQKFAGDTLQPKDTTKEPVHFNIADISIEDGEFYYQEAVIPVAYHIVKLNVDSEGKRWNDSLISLNYSFESGVATGKAHGKFSMNVATNDYTLDAIIEKYNLKFIEQYMKDMSNYGTFNADLDADVHASGNTKNAENLFATGYLALNDFHFGKNPNEDYLSFKTLAVDINALSPHKRIYVFDSISLTKPYFKYEKYDHLDNIQNMFGKGGSNIDQAQSKESFNLILELAEYVKKLTKNFLHSYYKIDKVAVYDGDLRYADFSLGEKFYLAMDPLNILADSVIKTRDRVKLRMVSGIKPYGDFQVNLSINPKDSSDFDLYYRMQRVPLSMFNPYTIRYTSSALDRGTFETNGVWHVRNGFINSYNHVILVDTRQGPKKKNKGNKWLPMSLIMFFINERGNITDYEVPIKGNLKDPNFKIRDIIFDILENIFVKPVSTPYRLKVRATEAKLEKYMSLQWGLRQSSLDHKNRRFVENISEFLEDNPEASISINPQLFASKEKEYIAFYEAKKKYYLSLRLVKDDSFTEKDSIAIERMSVKDSGFVKYLTKIIKDPMVFTVQEKCRLLLGDGFINNKLNALNKARQEEFMKYFRERGVDKRIKFTKVENTVPYNGFSFYMLSYKGDWPQELVEAYEEMHDLNEEAPRKRFKGIREKVQKLKQKILK